MFDEREIEKGLQWCVDNASETASMRSTYSHLDRFTKVLKAKLMQESTEKSVAGKEAYAMAHPDMVTHMNGLAVAEEQWLEMMYMRESIFAKADAWRTQCSNTRGVK